MKRSFAQYASHTTYSASDSGQIDALLSAKHNIRIKKADRRDPLSYIHFIFVMRIIPGLQADGRFHPACP